jgi:EpsI family protein
MPIVDRHLVVLLGVVALSGCLLVLPFGSRESSPAAPLEGLPTQVGNWRVVAPRPEWTLTADARASESLERTYTDGTFIVSLSVTRYPSRNDPRTRPAFHRIVPTRGVSRVVHDMVPVDLNGVVQGPIPLNRVSIMHEGKPSSVVYWYQLGHEVITGEYELRVRLFLDTLSGHRRSVVLVRLAASSPDALQPFLRTSFPHLIRL